MSVDYTSIGPVTLRERQGMLGEEGTVALPLNASSPALANFLLVKGGVGTLFGFSGFNNKAAAQFIQAFDALGVPADGAVPVFVMQASATSNFGVFWGETGRSFSEGIVICNSSTLATKTIGSADCWFDAQYI